MSSGTISASSIAEATQLLRREGRFAISLEPAEEQAASSQSSGGIRVSRNDVIELSTQLAIMVDTGVTITEALECIAAQTTRPKLKQLTEDLLRQVQAGSDFSTALSRHTRSFPRLYIALIRASEKSGMMGRMLMRATAYLRDEQEITRRFRGAMIYPSIMLMFAASTTIFLLAVVLPRFTSIYASKAAALPAPTKALMSASNFLLAHYVALPVTIICGCVVLWLLSQSESGQRLMHYLQLNLPILGPVVRKLHLTRSIRMIGTMAGAGVPLVECVATAQDLCGNVYFRELWGNVQDQIQAGRQLCEPMFESALVPRGVAQMIHSGEKSGKLALVMEQVATFAEQELKDKIAELSRYVEPAMIVIMGAIIGGVTLALLLPIFTISRVMSH